MHAENVIDAALHGTRRRDIHTALHARPHQERELLQPSQRWAMSAVPDALFGVIPDPQPQPQLQSRVHDEVHDEVQDEVQGSAEHTGTRAEERVERKGGAHQRDSGRKWRDATSMTMAAPGPTPSGAVVVDVRQVDEWEDGHISCAHGPLAIQDAPEGWQAQMLEWVSHSPLAIF